MVPNVETIAERQWYLELARYYRAAASGIRRRKKWASIPDAWLTRGIRVRRALS
jgi:hypothetical protein